MKILFLVGATSRIRNFHHTIMELAEHGHTVQLTGRLRKGAFELPGGIEHPRVTGRVNPTQRDDAWGEFVDLLRGARDYVRYFDPRYAKATRLVRRAFEIAPTEVVLFCERHPWVKRRWQAVSRALALAEDLVPSAASFENFLREERPDLILVTPLVTFESYQTDYVKAAHRLGIPIVFIPFSWDNLTNKGLMRIHPDRVLVWNDVQRNEAIELHGCAPEAVEVTGAARFDDFFARTPSTTREAFFAEYGLDPSRPMVLYLGSSQLTGPNEMELIRRWAEAMRASDDEAIRTCGLLIRPHPALRASWGSVSYADLPNVGLSLGASRGADQDLYDSLHHAHAAVGLNTSAMLEAAVVGRPVHTLVIPGFDEGQLGTMHFHYLVEAYGGLATVARDFAEHQRQLAPVLGGAPMTSSKSRAFAEQFLRPHGIDTPVSPRLTEAIERAAAEFTSGARAKRPRPSPPAWHTPARAALLALLRRRSVASRAVTDTTIVGTSMSLRMVRTALEEIQQATSPVFVGPWNDSVAHEVLYWIPFLRWATKTYGIPPERLFVVSRGTVGDWYAGLGTRYLDARTLFSPPELQHWLNRTVPQSEQDAKQAVMSPFDADILERAARAFDLSEYQVLHPSMLFRVVSRVHKDRTPERMADVLRHARLETSAGSRAAALPLPASFAALSVGFTPAFADTDENRQFLSSMVEQTAAERDVVIVDAPAADLPLPQSPRVHRLDAVRGNTDALAAQTRALAQADGFIGPFGDLAVLAAFAGTPAVTWYSERLPPDLVERVQAAASAGWGSLTVERARRFKGARLPMKVKA
jgi:hypothetical protein